MIIDIDDVHRIRPIKEMVENELIALPGVNGVDIGLKEVGGERTKIPCIIVYVSKKGEYAEGGEIPPSIEGIPTDVVEGSFEHLAARPETEALLSDTSQIDSGRYDPVKGGAQIAPARFDGMYGTVGMLVKDSTTNEEMWLSCYHVMCVDDKWDQPGINRAITQQSIWKGAKSPADDIGDIVRSHYGQIERRWAYDWYVDCAVSTAAGRPTSAAIISIGTPKGARNASHAALVYKYGSTTTRTTGVVRSTNATVKVNNTVFYYQVSIEPPFPGGAPFAQPGDSGAIVVDTDFYAVGMIMSGGGNLSEANPINDVLGAMEVYVSAA